ncbi:SDR family NAD(P)-dependent oxidoreductase [Planotetraspora mira]|uniref:SDR family NAD(P)-dependent oxidoreductase n=1 Tax=Planotetraspora mira TaxID=58121 RepID=UPI003570F64A
MNNAGRSHVGAVEETGESEQRALFEVHFFGPAALTRAALPHLRARRSGAIVQVSSMGDDCRSRESPPTARRSSRSKASPKRYGPRSPIGRNRAHRRAGQFPHRTARRVRREIE